MENRNDLSLVEKYRPILLKDVVSHTNITQTIQKFIDTDRLPHMLFYGSSGSGKTSTILAVARKVYGDHFDSMVMNLNASDDRGICVVRNKIKKFIETYNVYSNKTKLIILDEADSMTLDAQNALRRIIEIYSHNCRFCLICNYINNIIPALKSRCTNFRFSPLIKDQIIERVKYIINEEDIKITPDGLEAILMLGSKDMRFILNLLQVVSVSYPEITEETVYKCTGKPSPKQISAVVETLLNKKFSDGFNYINELQLSKGFVLSDFLEGISKCVCELDMPLNKRCFLLKDIAEIEYNLTFESDDRIQLARLVSTFCISKTII